MYIGPWQEYRLAKIQDDAIQRLRKEWEDQLREQIHGGDDARIRELMQPMMAKLPALLLASKSKSSSGTCSTRRGKPETSTSSSRASSAAARPPSSQSVASSSASATHRRIRSDEGGSSASAKAISAQPNNNHNNNQETHDAVADPALTQPLRPPGLKKKKKKKPAPQLSALEEVQRRKKMFSKWIKTAAAASEPSASTNSTETASTNANGPSVVLPPIHQRAPAAVHGPEAGDIAPETLADDEPAESDHDDEFQLPPIIGTHSTAHEWEFLRPYEAVKTSDETAADPAPDLEDSLDEDEVSNLLNWTDTLLSPNALLDGLFPNLDDDNLDFQ
ncbi:hypothetical protein Gpo141_00002718 [Globisporangium polare]